MNFVIDNREQNFIEHLSKKILEYPNMSFEVKQLDLGDMEVYVDDTLLYVWERKTFPDLISSIKDGRYKEQSYRLQNIHGNDKVVYLLEGIMSQINPPLKKLVHSTIAALSFKKKFHVLRSVHVTDSVDTFLAINDKLYRDYLSEQKQTSTDEGQSTIETKPYYSEFVKKRKKDNITADNIGEIILCQIPDLNTSSAKAIMNHVENNLTHLLEIIKTSPEELYNVRLEGETSRKISKKVVQRLIEYLGK